MTPETSNYPRLEVPEMPQWILVCHDAMVCTAIVICLVIAGLSLYSVWVLR